MNTDKLIAIQIENIRRLDEEAAGLLTEETMETVLIRNSEALSNVRARKANREQGILPHGDEERYYARQTALYLNRIEPPQINGDLLLELYGRLQNRALPQELLYRRKDMFVCQNSEAGETIAFVALPAEDIPSAMESFFAEYSAPASIYRACCLPMDFMNIHPLPDMNGRVSRVLFETALKQLGFRAAYFLPLEESICYETKRYLQVLAAANGRCYDEAKNHNVWVRYLLDRVMFAYALLTSRLKQKK